MRLPLIAACAVLALTACKPATEAAPSEPAPAPAPPEPIKPELNGVNLTEDLRALGTEPFWKVEMLAAELTFSSPDLPESKAPNPGPAMTVGQAEWSATTADGKALKITITGKDCSDGMSDRTYPLTATVVLAETTYHGCAATIAALDRTRGQESGEVR
jgi:uncharacterized membrane protein